MPRTTQPSIDDLQAGFTVIEALVALAVLAVCIVSIGSVMSANLHGVRTMEQHVELMQTARRVMAADIPARDKLQPGVLSGMDHGYSWRIDIRPMQQSDVSANETSDNVWLPQYVTIHVRSPSGGAVDLRTIRLMHGPSNG